MVFNPTSPGESRRQGDACLSVFARRELFSAYSDFATPRIVTLAPAGQPGSDVELILGRNRQVRNTAPGKPGDLFAGVLRITDSRGYSQVDLPVSATRSSPAGLWVGTANVTHVRAYLKRFPLGAGNQPVLGTATAGGVPYVVTNLNTAFGPASRSFPLRLIYHVGTNGEIRLVQRIFSGFDTQTNSVLTLRESLLDSTRLASARRIRAAHLPWSKANAGWLASGGFAQGRSLTNAARWTTTTTPPIPSSTPIIPTTTTSTLPSTPSCPSAPSPSMLNAG